MTPELSETLDPVRLAKAGAELKGSLKMNDMERLREHLSTTEGNAEYEFCFVRDSEGNHCIRGQVFAEIHLICQRCMGPLKKTLETKTDLIIVKNLEEARQIPEEFEALISDQMITLKGLVEDELLLALPAVPTHSIEDCPVKLESEADIGVRRKNPFAELSKLQVKK